MAKFKEKIIAQRLRHQGFSLKEISKQLKVSKSSASLWCRDLSLSKVALERLVNKQKIGSYKGRLKGARIQYKRRLKKIRFYEKEAIKNIKRLNNREFLIAGAMLYWAEGNKKSNLIQFANSDPEIIKFIVKWFKRIHKIKNDRFRPWIGINVIHKPRIKKVEKYWSTITGIPLSQFNKTILIRAKNKKIYKNYHFHYGTCFIRITRSSDILYQILAWIKAINRGRVAQW